MTKILVLGSTGQVGAALVPILRRIHGVENVIAGYHRKQPEGELAEGPTVRADVTSKTEIEDIVNRYDIDEIYNLAAVLSAAGERDPHLAWKINMEGHYNILELAREYKLRVFWPSSIAAFGPHTPKQKTPQHTIADPTTIYGITKYAGELLARYYVLKFDVDVRGVRWPGIISSETLPGGGTTDYAVEIFYYAIEGRKYTCYLREDTELPMMYMPDAVKSVIKLMEADRSKLSVHVGYNVTAFSFTPKQLVDEIRKYLPEFEVEYKPDFRQSIADSWPRSLDDSVAREEWGWEPEWDFEAMVRDMLVKVSRKLDRELDIAGVRKTPS